jgi:hypothetical protein
MSIPYELYKLLPKPLEFFEYYSYFSLPKTIVQSEVRKGLEKGLLSLRKGYVYPAKVFYRELQKVKNSCSPKECIKYIIQTSKSKYYQAKVFPSFKKGYSSRLVNDIPKVEGFVYLFVGAGNCIVDCLTEMYPFRKEQFVLIDIDKDIVGFYKERGFNAYFGDIRFISDAITPFYADVIVSYHIEYFQTVDNIQFASIHLKNFGYLYLFFASSELEDKHDFYLVTETLFHYKFWVTEITPLYIKAIKIEDQQFWENWNKM